MPKGYIYIMGNPSFREVKIGYTNNVERRRRELSSKTNVPDDYYVYATYETYRYDADRVLHAMIDNLNPNLRRKMSREFYDISPQVAFNLLETIAIISGTTNRLKKYSIPKKNDRRPPAKSGYYGSPNEPKRSKNPFENLKNPFDNLKNPFDDLKNPFDDYRR